MTPDAGVVVALDVPDGWDVAASETFPLLLVAPEADGFRANLGVSVEQFEPPTPEHLDARIEATKRQCADQLDGFAVVGERRRPQDGWPGWLMRSTWLLDDGRPVTQMIGMWVTGPRRLHEVHATTLRADEEANLPVLRAVVDSMRFPPDAETPDAVS